MEPLPLPQGCSEVSPGVVQWPVHVRERPLELRLDGVRLKVSLGVSEGKSAFKVVGVVKLRDCVSYTLFKNVPVVVFVLAPTTAGGAAGADGEKQPPGRRELECTFESVEVAKGMYDYLIQLCKRARNSCMSAEAMRTQSAAGAGAARRKSEVKEPRRPGAPIVVPSGSGVEVDHDSIAVFDQESEEFLQFAVRDILSCASDGETLIIKMRGTGDRVRIKLDSEHRALEDMARVTAAAAEASNEAAANAAKNPLQRGLEMLFGRPQSGRRRSGSEGRARSASAGRVGPPGPSAGSPGGLLTPSTRRPDTAATTGAGKEGGGSPGAGPAPARSPGRVLARSDTFDRVLERNLSSNSDNGGGSGDTAPEGPPSLLETPPAARPGKLEKRDTFKDLASRHRLGDGPEVGEDSPGFSALAAERSAQ